MAWAFLESVCDELPALRGFHRSTYCTNDVRAHVEKRWGDRRDYLAVGELHGSRLRPGDALARGVIELRSRPVGGGWVTDGIIPGICRDSTDMASLGEGASRG